MKKMKVGYLLLGFIAGVTYLVACGSSSSSIADTIGNAIDVVYDNVASGLSATNVQAAIDENAASIASVSSNAALTAAELVGSWTGTVYSRTGSVAGLTLTLNADGTYECLGDNNDSWFSSSSQLCTNPVSWEVLKRTIQFAYGDSPSYVFSFLTYFNTSEMEVIDTKVDYHSTIIWTKQ